ncbi:MAG: VOC family protein [Bryobacteraceae bacterium]
MAMREGFHTATPYIVIRDAAAAMEFYKKAFGATEIGRHADPDGKVRHGEIKIGDSPIMVCDEFKEFSQLRSVQDFGGSPMQVFLYVDDADAFAAKAQQEGATIFHPLQDQPYGRSGGLLDPFGLTWWVCTHKEM